MGKSRKVRFTVSGEKPIDGYAELILGMLAMSGVLRNQKMSKRITDNQVEIFIDCELAELPLGHMGLGDIPDAKDGQ